jgi:hypothetical protein
MNYRKIWIDVYGKIPKDENGVTFEIHHKDGIRTNNEIENLMCLSIQSHFDIHYSQKDWFACKLILKKLNIPAEIRAQCVWLCKI